MATEHWLSLKENVERILQKMQNEMKELHDEAVDYMNDENSKRNRLAAETAKSNEDDARTISDKFIRGQKGFNSKTELLDSLLERKKHTLHWQGQFRKWGEEKSMFTNNEYDNEYAAYCHGKASEFYDTAIEDILVLPDEPPTVITSPSDGYGGAETSAPLAGGDPSPYDLPGGGAYDLPSPYDLPLRPPRKGGLENGYHRLFEALLEDEVVEPKLGNNKIIFYNDNWEETEALLNELTHVYAGAAPEAPLFQLFAFYGVTSEAYKTTKPFLDSAAPGAFREEDWKDF